MRLAKHAAMRLVGCFLIMLLLAAEIVTVVLLSGLWQGEVFGTLVVLIVLSFVGWKLVSWRKARLPAAMLQGDYSALVAMFGAALIAMPGFLTGFVGILLQIPLFRKQFAGLAAKLAAGMMKKAMSGGFGAFGGAGGFPGGGGFPGAGGFPGGGSPAGGLRPDESLSGGASGKKKKATKTIDTTVRKE